MNQIESGGRSGQDPSVFPEGSRRLCKSDGVIETVLVGFVNNRLGPVDIPDLMPSGLVEWFSAKPQVPFADRSGEIFALAKHIGQSQALLGDKRC